MSVAGAGYAAFWAVMIGARVLFTYGADHCGAQRRQLSSLTGPRGGARARRA